MKFLVFIFLILQLFVQNNCILHPRKGELTEKEVQVFKISPETTLEQKWDMVFQQNDNKKIFLDFIDKFVDLVYHQKIAPQEFYDNLEDLVERYSFQHKDMVEEIKIISKLSGVELKKLYILNFTYEIFAFQKACASIVVRQQNGDILLGRNIDYFFEHFYSQLSIQFDHFNQKNQKIYSVSAFVGYVISVTGTRYGKYTISFNQRSVGSAKDNYNAFLQGAFANEYLIRQILKSVENYNDAVEILKKEQIIAACYYIVAGIKQNEGIIIERNRDGPYNFYELTDEQWYIVVTNFDKDKEDEDGRREAAIGKLQQLGQKQLNIFSLKNEVLTQFPLLHIHTITTTISCPKYNYYQSGLWY